MCSSVKNTGKVSQLADKELAAIYKRFALTLSSLQDMRVAKLKANVLNLATLHNYFDIFLCYLLRCVIYRDTLVINFKKCSQKIILI